jgi:hypothetical protein
MAEIDFDAALEAGAKAHFNIIKKGNADLAAVEWEELGGFTKYTIKESILPIVNAVLLSIKGD